MGEKGLQLSKLFFYYFIFIFGEGVGLEQYR